MRPILLAGLFALPILMQAEISPIARADGMIYQVPADGNSVRYDSVMTVSDKGRQDQIFNGSLTVSSVGMTTVDNEKCRWIEFKNVQKTAEGDRIVFIAKCLIPEKDLGKGKSPDKHMIRGWLKEEDMEPRAISEIKLQSGAMLSLLGYLAGPARNTVELEIVEIDGPLGKLACAGVNGEYDFKSGTGSPTLNLEHRLHEKAPFGIVTATSKFEIKGRGKVVIGSRTTKLTLAEINTNAVTELPERD